MAENADDPSLYWIEPEQRGVIPLDGFHLPRRLARTVRTDRYKVYIDRDFAAVLDGCAAPEQGPRPHLDQHAHPFAIHAPARDRPLPLG